MAERQPLNSPPTLAFDNLDIDLIVKVASNTIFSPFFCFFVPVMYKGMGAPWDAPTVIYPSVWAAIVTLFWFVSSTGHKYRNRGTPGRLNWGEQIILITGGSSGIGYLLANTLAIRHVTVIVLDVVPIETENYNITYYKCDISKWSEVEAVAKKIKEEIGDPTVLVNNAGVVQNGKLIIDKSEEELAQTFGVNVIGHFNILRAFLPAIIEQKQGHIVTVASVLGQVACSLVSDYCASKASVIALHESLRYELNYHHNAPRVRTTILTPGLIHTPMFSRAGHLGAGSPLPKWLYNFFLPPLAPHTIVKAIIAALDEQESRWIHLPFWTHLGYIAPALPLWLRDIVQWVSGADYSMQGFQKTTGKRSSELKEE